MIVPYNRDLDIRNVEALPQGTGCKYLLCLFRAADGVEREDHDVYIAKSWHRKLPNYNGDQHYRTINFGGQS